MKKTIFTQFKNHDTIREINGENKKDFIEEIEEFIDGLNIKIEKKRSSFAKSIKPLNLKKKYKKKMFLKPTYLFIFIIVLLLITYLLIIPILQGNLCFLIVLSGSMYPTIKQGDIVVSESINVNEINKNDIITFINSDQPDNYITHRIINIIPFNDGILRFQTKGDANNDLDDHIVLPSEIVGKVSIIIPYLGYVPHFAQSLIGLFSLIIIPGLLIMMNEALKIRKNIHNENQTKKKKNSLLIKIKNETKKIENKDNLSYLLNIIDYEIMERKIDRIIYSQHG